MSPASYRERGRVTLQALAGVIRVNAGLAAHECNDVLEMRIRTAILSSVILLGIVAAGASLFVLRSGSDNESGVVIPAGEGRILFFSNRTGSTEIYSINPDGEGLKHLTASPGNATSPAWSPRRKPDRLPVSSARLWIRMASMLLTRAGGERRRVAPGCLLRRDAGMVAGRRRDNIWLPTAYLHNRRIRIRDESVDPGRSFFTSLRLGQRVSRWATRRLRARW